MSVIADFPQCTKEMSLYLNATLLPFCQGKAPCVVKEVQPQKHDDLSSTLRSQPFWL